MQKTNTNQMIHSKENKLLDIFKFFAALLIVASHCLPLVPNNYINFLYGQWFFRFCVPLFLISSGYFFASFENSRKIKYIKRIAIIYCISALLYMPFYANNGIITLVRYAILGYHHLWYLSALVLSLLLYFVLEKTPLSKIFNKLYPFVALLLIIIGAFYDEYQYIFSKVNSFPLVVFINKAIQFTGGPRHALFFGFPMILIGKFLHEHQSDIKIQKATCIVLIVVSFFVSLAEGLTLRHFGGESITCDITLFNYLPAVFLLILTFSYCPKVLESLNTKAIRKTADIVYISHILIIELVNKFLGIKYIPRLVLVLIVSVAVSCLYIKIEKRILKKYQERLIRQ